MIDFYFILDFIIVILFEMIKMSLISVLTLAFFIVGAVQSATQFCQQFTENVADPTTLPLISPQFQFRLEGTYNESKAVASYLIHYDPLRMKASLSETKIDVSARQILNYLTNEIYIIRGKNFNTIQPLFKCESLFSKRLLFFS